MKSWRLLFSILIGILVVTRLSGAAPTPTPGGDVTASIDDAGTLHVVGAAGDHDEKVQISHVGDKIVVAGFGGTRIDGAKSKSFDASDVKEIDVDLGAGDNEYRIDGTGSTTTNPPLVIDHGAGNDLRSRDGRNRVVVRKWQTTSIEITDVRGLLSQGDGLDDIFIEDVIASTIDVFDGMGDDNYTIRRVNGATVTIKSLGDDTGARNTMIVEGEVELMPDGPLVFIPCEDEDED